MSFFTSAGEAINNTINWIYGSDLITKVMIHPVYLSLVILLIMLLIILFTLKSNGKITTTSIFMMYIAVLGVMSIHNIIMSNKFKEDHKNKLAEDLIHQLNSPIITSEDKIEIRPKS